MDFSAWAARAEARARASRERRFMEWEIFGRPQTAWEARFFNRNGKVRAA
jgi:hypothetical protein